MNISTSTEFKHDRAFFLGLFAYFHTTGVSDSTSVKQKSKGNATKRNLLTAKLGHGQDNNRLYWLLTDFQIWCRLVQGFTTKGAFVRLLYKLILIALNQIWGSNFRVWMSRARNLNTLKSRSRNLKSQNVSGSQRKTLVSRSRKVSHLPFATPPSSVANQNAGFALVHLNWVILTKFSRYLFSVRSVFGILGMVFLLRNTS